MNKLLALILLFISYHSYSGIEGAYKHSTKEVNWIIKVFKNNYGDLIMNLNIDGKIFVRKVDGKERKFLSQNMVSETIEKYDLVDKNEIRSSVIILRTNDESGKSEVVFKLLHSMSLHMDMIIYDENGKKIGQDERVFKRI